MSEPRYVRDDGCCRHGPLLSARDFLAAERAKTAALVEAAREVIGVWDVEEDRDGSGYCYCCHHSLPCAHTALRAAIKEASDEG